MVDDLSRDKLFVVDIEVEHNWLELLKELLWRRYDSEVEEVNVVSVPT